MEELKIKYFFSNFQTCCLEVSFRALQLEKMHTTLYLFCFHMSYFIFGIKKEWSEKRILFFHWQRTSLRGIRFTHMFSLWYFVLQLLLSTYSMFYPSSVIVQSVFVGFC